MLENGYIGAPIIVNEFMEVIDGQNRLEACKQHGIPIEYTVKRGMRMKEAVALNAYQTSWKLTDYIKAYAEEGREPYVRLLNLINYHKFSTEVILKVCGTAKSGANIKSGTFKLDEESYKTANVTLAKLSKFKQFYDCLGSRPVQIYGILAKLIKADLIDTQRLCEQFEKYGDNFKIDGDIKTALQDLNDLYNYRRTTKMYFIDKYREIYG